MYVTSRILGSYYKFNYKLGVQRAGASRSGPNTYKDTM